MRKVGKNTNKLLRSFKRFQLAIVLTHWALLQPMLEPEVGEKCPDRSQRPIILLSLLATNLSC